MTDASTADRYEIENSRGEVVAHPKTLDEATRLFWVGFNSHKIVCVHKDGTRHVIAEKGRGA